MRLPHAFVIALLISPVRLTAQEHLGTYEDRIAVASQNAAAVVAAIIRGLEREAR